MNGADGFLFVGSAPHPAADGPGAERDSRTNKICTCDVHVFQHGCPSLFFDRGWSYFGPSHCAVATVLSNSCSAPQSSEQLSRQSDHVRPLPLEPKCARFSICRITAEKSCSAPSSDCLALISKAAPAAGIRAPTVAASSRIRPKSLFISRIGNCGL